MKKLALILVMLLGSLSLSLPANNIVSAATDPFEDACKNISNGAEKPPACKETGKEDPISGADGRGALVRITELVSIAVGVASIIGIIIGGFQFVMSSGDPARISTAKNTVLFAIIGLAIAAIARFIVTIVISNI